MAPVLGALFAIVIGFLAIRPYLGYQRQSFENVEAANTAAQFRQILNAVQAYIQSGCPGESSNGCQVGPVSLSALQPDFLPPTISGQSGANGTTIFYNPYGQQWNATIETVTVANSSQPAFQALVYTTGGNQIPLISAPEIAAETGAEGGFFPYSGQYGSNTPDDTAMGAYGHWQVPSLSTSYGISASNYALAGHLAGLLYFSPNGTLNQDYLYRNAIPGDPDANTMNANINMNNKNSITNAETIQVGNQSGSGQAPFMAEMANTTDDKLPGGLVVTSDPKGQNTSAMESDSIGSSVILSADTFDQNGAVNGSNTATMTTTSSQASLALAGSASSLTLNGSESNLSVTGTQANLLIGQSTTPSAQNLQFISTPEQVGTPCYSSTAAIPAWGTPNTTTYYTLGTIAPNSDGTGRPVVCVQSGTLVNSNMGSYYAITLSSPSSGAWQLMGNGGFTKITEVNWLYPFALNSATGSYSSNQYGNAVNVGSGNEYLNNTGKPLFISSNCPINNGSNGVGGTASGNGGTSINFYISYSSSGTPTVANAAVWTLAAVYNYGSPSSSIIVPPGYAFAYSIYAGNVSATSWQGWGGALTQCQFALAY